MSRPDYRSSNSPATHKIWSRKEQLLAARLSKKTDSQEVVVLLILPPHDYPGPSQVMNPCNPALAA